MTENSYGYLRVTVRTAGGAIPVSRAIVTVKDENETLMAVKREYADFEGARSTKGEHRDP